MSPQELKARIASGLLSFPVTHFNADFSLNLPSYQKHVSWLSGFDAAGLFAAGGTGELFSLTPQQIGAVTRAAKEASVSMPIISRCGYGRWEERRERKRGVSTCSNRWSRLTK